MKLIAATACVAAAFGLAACSKTLDTGDVESELNSQFGDAGLADASCPDDVDAEAGNTFECTATAGGQEVTIKVDQLDDEGNIEMQVVGAASGGGDDDSTTTEDETTAEDETTTEDGSAGEDESTTSGGY